MEVAQVIVWILYVVSIFFFYRAVFQTHRIVKSIHAELLGTECPCEAKMMKKEEMMKEEMPMDKM